MVSLYQPWPQNELRQGEILGPLYVHSAAHPATRLLVAPVVNSRRFDASIVLTADCDLLNDYTARREAAAAQRSPLAEPNALPMVVLCPLFPKADLVLAASGREVWRRITQNQNERYHYLPRVRLEEGSEIVVPEYYVDFKQAFGIPPDQIYGAIEAGEVWRPAHIGPVFLQDLVHRAFGFMSRVGPDVSQLVVEVESPPGSHP